VLGCDFAGTVEEVCGAPSNGLKRGDRVAGLVYGGTFADEGSYAEYLKAEHDLLIKLPEHLSFEQGASYGLAFMTAVHVSLA
jgi:NADPH:quinone reductase-like Zn-dependent oxidoreductase